MVSSLSFRGVPLGSQCTAVEKLNHRHIRPLKRPYDLNPSGDFHRITALYGEEIGVSYTCRSGILIGGEYSDIPISIYDRLMDLMRQEMGQEEFLKIATLYDNLVEIAKEAEKAINPDIVFDQTENTEG